MSKHKIIYYSIAVFVLLVIYLYVANGFIYYRIGQGNLVLPHRQLSYYMANNENPTNLTYVALGDSLTSGVGAENYEESYPYILATKMSESGKTITSKNFSAPGAKTKDIIYTFLNPAIEANPDVITILIGVNDVHNHIGTDQFERNYRYIVEKILKETKAKIYLINIPSIGSDTIILPPLKYYFDSETNKYNDVIKELSVKYNLTYIDLNSPTKALLKTDGVHYSVDSFHPSAYGYKLWANIIYDGLNQ